MPENSLRSFFAILLVAGAVCLHTSGVARGESRGIGKLKQPQKILSALQGQGSTVPVLVSLEVPAEVSSASSFKSAKALKKRRDEIHSRQTSVLSSLGVSEFTSKHRYKNFASFSGETTMAGLNKLLDNPMVKSVELDKKQYPLTAQGIPLMNADVPRLSYNGQGVSIAICDTGIDYNHPMLGNGSFPNSKIVGGYDTGGTKDFKNDPDSDPFPHGPNPNNAHGTTCAGIAAGDIGAVGDYIGGVAHGAKIYALKISADNDNSALSSDAIDAWDWCVTHKDDDPANPILIISYSFGSGRYLTAASAESDRPASASAAEDVVAAGITILAASGNDGYCNSLSAPAAFSSVISVGAVYDADIENYYPCINDQSCATKNSTSECTTGYYAVDNTAADMVTSYSNTADFLDVLAPSNDAYTTDITGLDGYSTGDYDPEFGGTSAACPYAAGVAACLQSAVKAVTGNYLTPAEIKTVLVSSGDNITDSKVAITKPRVNLEQAILSFASPPQASNLSTTIVYNTPVTIAMQAADEGVPNPPSGLEYVITSLASQGTLKDINETEITTAPYTLADSGNEVIYTPRSGCGATATFKFVADDGGVAPIGGTSNEATVTIRVIPYVANMDNDPGWTFDDANWQWGTPTGSAMTYGYPDPTSGHTGSKVVGYNLNGAYANNMSSTKWATTPVIDCTAMMNVTLNFYRWLNVESALNDHAYIEVSNNGSTWNRIWQNAGSVTESSWSFQSYDISAFADDQSTVYVRWGIGPTDATWNFSGWNIDDVELISSSLSLMTGDFVQDCQVDRSDLTIMMRNWLKQCGDCEGTDLNTDGSITFEDFSLFAQHWLEGVLP
ncbi:MAG: S8 family serine peptidase [Planctomycetes bacterium]|nr:S8 family serine peptidase [Planctomycetota bacterium]